MGFKSKAILGLSLVTLLTSPNIKSVLEYKSLVQIVQPSYAQSDQASISFNKAQEEHTKGDLENAKTLYDLVVRDFPETDLAPEASLRSLLIEFVSERDKSKEEGKERDKSTEYIQKALDVLRLTQQPHSKLEEEYMSNAYGHFKEEGKFKAEGEKIAQNILRHFSFFEANYIHKIGSRAWKIPDIPESLTDCTIKASTLSGTEYDNFLDKVSYNERINDISTNGKIEPLKLKLTLGMILYRYKSTTTIGKSKIEEVVKLTENDPYNILGHAAKDVLTTKPLYLYYEKKSDFWKRHAINK